MAKEEGGPLVSGSRVGSGTASGASGATSVVRRLYEILESAFTVDDVCRRAASIVSHGIDVETSSVWLLDPSASTLHLAARAGRESGAESAVPSNLTMPVSDEFPGRALGLGRAVESTGAEVRSTSPMGPRRSTPREAPAIAIPLRSDETTLGVLVIADPALTTLYLAAKSHLLEAIAAAISHVIVIARAHHECIRERMFRYERLAMVGQLAASTAHEANNILTSLILQSQKIARHPDVTAELRESVQSLQSEAERIGKLVNGLLQPARARREARRPVDLGAVMQRTIELTSPLFSKSRKVRVETALAPDLPHVLAEPSELEQVFTNLILNALQATGSGGVVRIFTRVEGDWVIGGVGDTGSGIPKDVLPHLFEPFFTTRSGEGGSGLGLPIVKEIVKSHQGEIEIDTAEGSGSEFRVRLPRHR